MAKNLRLLISGALLGLVAWRLDWRNVRDTFVHVHVGLWLCGVALYLATQFVSSWRWQILARPLGFERPLWQYAGFYFIGMYFNLVLPTSVGGDVVRAWYLDGKTGRRLSALLSVFIDRLSGLVVLVVLAGVASLVSPMRLPAWTMVSVWTAVAAAVSGLLILPRFSRSSAFAGRLARLGSEVGQSLRLMFRPLPMLLSVIVQSANVILVWLVATAIGVPVPFAYCWVLVPMVTLLTLLPVSINGMGVREGATIAFLTPLGIAAGPAVSVSFLWFLVFTAASLVGGAVYLFGRFPRPEIGPDNRTVGPIRGPDHGPVGDHPDQGRTGQRAAAA